MKKIYRYGLLIILMFVSFSMSSKVTIKAAEILASTQSNDIFGETISSIEIYSDGKIKLAYRYGIRKVDLFYCQKGDRCDNGVYSVENIMESSSENPYKNDGLSVATITFKADLPTKDEYRIRVEAYFGTSNAYSGTESINGSFTVGAVQIADTNDKYINGTTKKDHGIKDENMSKTIDKIEYIINIVVLPIIYSCTTLFLVVKGGIMGVQIVKSADNIDVRREKVRGLIWLVVGVAVTFLATTVIGLITGFFKSFL